MGRKRSKSKPRRQSSRSKNSRRPMVHGVWRTIALLGWVILIALIAWLNFGDKISAYLRKALSEPLAMVQAVIEGFGWIRLVIETALRFVFKRH